MLYRSTRGAAESRSFEDVLLAGTAADGGLYVPQAWPSLGADNLRALRGHKYSDLAANVLAPFVGDGVGDESLGALSAATYDDGAFEHSAVAPLVQLDGQTWLMELFHGPSLAFKDHALQFLGRAFDAALARRGRRMTVIGATSGDTGSAAIEACRGRANIDTVILYPKGRVSEVQRRQMTTVQDANIHPVAVEGTFDDCQRIVKALFADPQARDELALGAVNSINWARIAAQAAYYVAAAVSLGAPERSVAFAVPTGNFGNVYAAYVAGCLGVPIERLIVGTNVNDALFRLIDQGEMAAGEVKPTLSPSMDIQVPSNLERLVFELLDNDGAAVRDVLAQPALTLPAGAQAHLQDLFAAARLDDRETLDVMARTYKRTGQLIDPHTAVGLGAAARVDVPGDVPVVALGCAHPAKFPEAVDRATGRWPHLPPRLSDLFDRPEREITLPAETAAVQRYIARHRGAAEAHA